VPVARAGTAAGLFAVLVSGGCATATLTCDHPIAEPVRAVSLSVAPAASMDAEQTAHLEAVLTETLEAAGIDVVPAGSASHGLTGEVQVYHPGSRVLRTLGWPIYLGWLGVGKFVSEWRVTDAGAAPVDRCDVTGAVSWGVLGGSYDLALEQVGLRLAEYLERAPQYSRH
jgi:hypothetical protein